MRVNHNNSLTVTVENDMRITRIGKILRKYKIDEIPELINVLIGDMSFVGQDLMCPDMLICSKEIIEIY